MIIIKLNKKKSTMIQKGVLWTDTTKWGVFLNKNQLHETHQPEIYNLIQLNYSFMCPNEMPVKLDFNALRGVSRH